MREIGEIMSTLGIILMGVSYIWSFIIGYRIDIAWLIGLLVMWIFVYPPLVFTNWGKTKNNFYVFLAGLGLTTTSFIILKA